MKDKRKQHPKDVHSNAPKIAELSSSIHKSDSFIDCRFGHKTINGWKITRGGVTLMLKQTLTLW
jgi:hypothetical protein